MVVNHNLSAMNANRTLGIVTTSQSKVAEKLSSGYRINRSADDAAGLSISEKMRVQVRGLDVASRNSQDGISYIQTAEGALNEIHSLLQRGKELSVQAANDTNQTVDRQAIQSEIDEINKEIDRISQVTEFNTMKIFDSSNAASSAMFSYGAQDFSSAIAAAKAAGMTQAFTQEVLAAFAEKLKDTYVPGALSNITSTMSAFTPSVGNMGIGLEITYENSNALAYCASNGVGYALIVNLKYLDMSGESITASEDLPSTITHELTHAVMFDTLTNGMLATNGADRLPTWFVEGTAQCTGGALDYCQELDGIIKRGGTNSDIAKWLSKMSSTADSYNAYAQGYIGCMYLGYVAGGKSAVDAQTIRSGLNAIIQDVADGYSLSEAIYKETQGAYDDLLDFENSVGNDAVQFAKDLYTAVGSGAGSIVSSVGLDGDKATLLNKVGGDADYFTLDVDNKSVDNISLFNSAGVNPYTGGGAVTTPGTNRSGTINSNASTTWGSRSGGGTSLNALNTSDLIHLQAGALEGQNIDIKRWKLSKQDLGLGSVSVNNHAAAGAAMTSYDSAIDAVSSMRSYYGAMQNRLEHTIANLDNTSENTQSAESRIRDADIAELMVEYSKDNILSQAGQAMLASANQSKNGVLQLLQ